jgi:MoaA/NifB/PqqE/SkfB family radical SAM enzyme
MELSGVHLLLTYKCTAECEHCFLWCSPGSEGTMTIRQIGRVLRQAKDIPSVTTVFFEGGEPFLFYPVLVEGVRMAREAGFEVGIVSNAFWATDRADAVHWLEPLARHEIAAGLSLSADEHHGATESERNTKNARSAAKVLRVPTSILSVRGVEYYSCPSDGKDEKGDLYFRGRAAARLAKEVPGKDWRTLDKCPEEPPDISRVHVDSFGNVQFCQGITIGNLWKKPLKRIMKDLDADRHPIIGPLMRGGPAALAEEHEIRPRKKYADACHMCYELRCALRERGELEESLIPDQAYGVGADSHE